MSTASLAVGLSVAGIVVLLTVVVIVAYCVYRYNHPQPSTKSPVRQLIDATKSIKQRANKKKSAIKNDKTCCGCSCYKTHNINAGIPPPDPPHGLHVINPSSSELTITWKKPANRSFAVRIDRYQVFCRELMKPKEWIKVASVGADVYTCRIKKLVPFKKYVFSVATKNKGGTSIKVETKTITLQQDRDSGLHSTEKQNIKEKGLVTGVNHDIEKQPERPGKPMGPLKYARINPGSITLSWKPPVNDGGSSVTGFAVEKILSSETSKTSWRKVGVCEATKTRFTTSIANLPEGVGLKFRVVAINNIGNSDPLEGAVVHTNAYNIPLSVRVESRVSSEVITARENDGISINTSRNSYSRSSNKHNECLQSSVKPSSARDTARDTVKSVSSSHSSKSILKSPRRVHHYDQTGSREPRAQTHAPQMPSSRENQQDRIDRSMNNHLAEAPAHKPSDGASHNQDRTQAESDIKDQTHETIDERNKLKHSVRYADTHDDNVGDDLNSSRAPPKHETVDVDGRNVTNQTNDRASNKQPANVHFSLPRELVGNV